MKVSDLIKHLQSFPADFLVVKNHDLGTCAFTANDAKIGYWRPDAPFSNALDCEDYDWQDEEDKHLLEKALIIG